MSDEPLTPEQEAMALANVGLIGWTVNRYRRSLVSDLYGNDDAMAAGWFGLCNAVRKFDPDRGLRFATMATVWIRQAIQADKLRFDGINHRRAHAGRAEMPEVTLSIDAPLPSGASLEDIIPAPYSDPAPVATMRADLDGPLRAGIAVCRDDLDRAVLAAIVWGDPIGSLANAAGVSQQTAALRAKRLRAAMRGDDVPLHGRVPVAGERRAGRKPQPIQHGTRGGHLTHRRRNEPSCAECKAAYTAHNAARYRAKKNQARSV